MLRRTLASQRSFLGVGVVLVSLLALLPLAALLWVASRSGWAGLLALGPSGGEQIQNTLLLLVGVGVLGACLGTANGWLTARCHFPGRRWLQIAQLLPLAIPSYLLAATLMDMGSRVGWRVHGLAWAVLVLSLSTYSYVFLLSTECFGLSGARLQDASRSLGVGPWGCFWRVALPMAVPAIGSGVALAGMEVVNEFGAVQLLGVPTLSAGILDRWQGDGDIEGAIGLALVTMVIVVALVVAERGFRRRSRLWSAGQESAPASRWPLEGWRQGLAQLCALLPPLASLGFPLLWVGISWGATPVGIHRGLGELVAAYVCPGVGRHRDHRGGGPAVGGGQALASQPLAQGHQLWGGHGLCDSRHRSGFGLFAVGRWPGIGAPGPIGVGLRLSFPGGSQGGLGCCLGAHSPQR